MNVVASQMEELNVVLREMESDLNSKDQFS